jgi:hypothetical protein
MYFDRSNAYQWLWTLYVVIAGGLLAFSSLRARQDLITLLLVTVLFLFFAYKNGSAIGDVLAQRHALLSEIKQTPNVTPAVRDAIIPSLITPDWPGTRTFHIASDILVVAALWSFELRRYRQAAQLRREATAPKNA